jgi:hypothetical protein
LRDRIAVAAFLALWLLPVAWIGLSGRRPPLVPNRLCDLATISCLFTHAQPVWNAYYVHVQTREGGPWVELDETEAFAMQPFGHRTRMHRFLVEWGDRGDRGREELARFLVRRQIELHPEAPRPLALRFVWAAVVVDAEHPPQGAWRKPALRELPANAVRILSEHRFDRAEDLE